MYFLKSPIEQIPTLLRQLYPAILKSISSKETANNLLYFSSSDNFAKLSTNCLALLNASSRLDVYVLINVFNSSISSVLSKAPLQKALKSVQLLRNIFTSLLVSILKAFFKH